MGPKTRSKSKQPDPAEDQNPQSTGITSSTVPPPGPSETTLATVSGSFIVKLHTAFALSAFLVAFLLGTSLHYKRIVKNQHFGYPHEWLPSVSATIGDWFPERQVYQIFIALTALPRFTLCFLTFLTGYSRFPTSSLPAFVGTVGVIRTISCGGWSFITSSDWGLGHDVAMVTYIVCNVPWMIGVISLSPSSKESAVKKYRIIAATSFFGCFPALIYFYIQHKVHAQPGAYSKYAIFEWSLILLDVVFDHIAAKDFGNVSVSFSLSRNPIPHDVYLHPVEKNLKPTLLQKLWTNSRDWRFILSESYLAFVFWSHLTALGPMIFYQSVWSMGLSGDEAVAGLIVLPAFLCIPPLREFLADNIWFTNLFLLVGQFGFLIDDKGESRLKLGGVVVGVLLLGNSARWWAAGAPGRAKTTVSIDLLSVTFLNGLIISLVLKLLNFSINPIWPFMSDSFGPLRSTGGWNTAGILLTLLSISIRPTILAPELLTSVEEPKLSCLGKTSIGIGFGFLFWLVHYLFTDSGTILSWVWDGHPALGPIAPRDNGWLITALVFGIITFQSSLHTPPSASPPQSPRSKAISFMTSSVAFWMALWLGRKFDVEDRMNPLFQWAAFIVGLQMAARTAGLFPIFLRAAATSDSPGLTFGSGFLVYLVMKLASVWTVAYAFVPMGWVLRERTDIVYGLTIFGVVLGCLNVPWSEETKDGISSADNKKLEKEKERLFYAYQSRAAWSRKSNILLSFCACFGIFVGILHSGSPKLAPFHQNERLVTAGIWTMHFALDGKMWESQRRIKAALEDAELDIIGMLETDLQRVVMGNRDMTQYLASELGYYADPGPGPNRHTWGVVLLSRFPIIESTHHLLPSPVGELAPAIHATLNVYGVEVDVVVSHNGQEEDPLDRQLQSEYLAARMALNTTRPTIFLGYVVTKPHAKKPSPYQILVEDGKMLDVDPFDYDRWCEYILYRGLHRVGYARINRGSDPSITDTELQTAKFVVPLPQDERNATIEGLASGETTKKRTISIPLHNMDAPTRDNLPSDMNVNRRVAPTMMRKGLHYPSKFQGRGTRGHYFHVLKNQKGEFAPLYYMTKQEAKAHEELGAMAMDDCKNQ